VTQDSLLPHLSESGTGIGYVQPSSRLREASADQAGVETHVHQRYPVDARQVGVPLVRHVSCRICIALAKLMVRWDTAFHCLPLAMVDPSFAKKQLDLMTREWYMKPDGALPAYEWNFSDVNPPVHAWATFRVFKIERKMFGREDLDFLERVFQKLLLNFTW